MQTITLGRTGIKTVQNAFGALPIQRVSKEKAVQLLRKAYEGGMRYFDTARAYSDSEEKMGEAFGDGYVKREEIYIATKTHALKPEKLREDLATSLSLLKTDYIDVYQLHCAPQCFKPGDGTGLYEAMEEAKTEGKIRHISITAHKIEVAIEAAKSGLYDTIQFPFSYLASEKELELYRLCKENNIGFICMKGMAGGLITDSRAAMAFMTQYDNALPIWGIQREKELEEWLSYMNDTPQMTPEIRAYIEKEKKELAGNFCRSCGYCMPCPMDIQIHQCNRMSLMLRRAPAEAWLTEKWQKEMMNIENCIECRQCVEKCPYDLDIPNTLKQNLEDYKKILAGEVSVQ